MRLIAAHLARLEATLTRTQTAVAALRDLLEQSPSAAPIHHCQMSATTAAAITATVDRRDVLIWYHGALGELKAAAAAQQLRVSGPAGGIFADELFTEGGGQATIFLPCTSTVQPVGRVVHTIVPSVELATMTQSVYRLYQQQRLHLAFEIPRGLHVYGSPVPEGYVPLTVGLDPRDGLSVGTIALPAPRPFNVEGLKEDFFVHEGRLDVVVPFSMTCCRGTCR